MQCTNCPHRAQGNRILTPRIEQTSVLFWFDLAFKVFDNANKPERETSRATSVCLSIRSLVRNSEGIDSGS